jgi:Spy/CpxP family protein refolding chaperone
MNRIRTLAIAAAMLLVLPALAQQNATPSAQVQSLPSVDDHLHMLTQKLSLTADQQQKARPILEEMQAGMQQIADDKSLTHDEAMSRMHPVFMKADKQMRVFLTEDQKKKLDDLEEQSHPGMHANAGSSGAPQN